MNIYEINANWYDGDTDSGSVKIYYTNEPTIEEIADHIRMPRIMEDRMNERMSDFVEPTSHDVEENHYHLSVHESDMHFSVNMTIGNVIDNGVEEEMPCDECDEA